MNFLLGVSITINVILFFLIFLILKFRKFLSIFTGLKYQKNHEIEDMMSFKDFMDSDKL